MPHGPLDGTRHGKLVVKRLHQPHGAQRKDPAGRSQRGLGGRYAIISDDRAACQARSAQDVAGGLHDYALPFCTENARFCRDEGRRDHRVSGRQGPAMRTRLPTITMPHDTAARTLARLHIGPDADHGAWSSRRGHPHT